MNIDEITRIAELMTAHDLTEFLVESQDIKLTLRRHREAAGPTLMTMAAPAAAPVMAAAPAAMAPSANPGAADTAAAGAAEAPAAAARKVITIDSPIVGTFYTSATPDAPPFIKVGDRVREDTTVCIVEAMKVMNEIKAEKSGIVRKVLVENTKPVEYGQPMFELEEG